MTPPTSIDEIPWSTEDEAAPIATNAPRKCKHPRERRFVGELVEAMTLLRSRGFATVLLPPGGGTSGAWCLACGHAFDPEKQRRGRAVRKYGKKEELVDARELGLEPRGTSRDPEDSGGALDPAVVQSKTGPVHYPSASWIAELDALERVAAGRPRILVATEKLGRGKRRRKVAVLFLEELQALTGLAARRPILEEIAAIAKRAVDTTGYPFDRAMDDLVEKLIELEKVPR